MSRLYHLAMAAAIAFTACPAFAQNAGGEAASADPNGAAAPKAVSASNREKIAKVNGMSTSYSTGQAPVIKGGGSRTHTVVDGDTLWDLSGTYLADPFMWPALWSFNPQITNPHWIYPGDIIYLEPYEPTLVVAAPEDAPRVALRKGVGRGVINVPGIYLSNIPDSKGHILYSDQEKHMLTLGDEVQIDWVDIEMRKKVTKGQKFVVFYEDKAVRGENGDELAHKLIRAGVIELIDPQPNTLSTARIVKAYREIERGNLIIPNMDLDFTITKTANSNNMEGKIIDTIDKNSQLGEQQYVIINRGSDDGVVSGNTFTIFEQREGLERLPYDDSKNTQYASDKDRDNNRKDKKDEDKDQRDTELDRDLDHSWVLGRPTRAPEFPKREDLDEIYGDREYTTADLPLRKIGDVMVINVQDKFSTGIIIDNSREIEVDTRVVMIKGY